jgi:hypothetical protein
MEEDKMNNLYEFGSACDVVIRCKSKRTIGGKTYEANEPYTILRDVYVSVGYRTIASQADTTSNILAYREGLPDVVSISNIELNTKICDLIAERAQIECVNKFCESIGTNGKLYLPETPYDSNIFIVHNNESITGFIKENDVLIGDFVDGEQYLVFYTVAATGDAFKFEVPSYGYFSLDIVGKGNSNKQTQNIYITFPAVSLMSVPVFNMVNGTILNVPMQFECIHKCQKDAHFVIGD